jgi:hypothetical protein
MKRVRSAAAVLSALVAGLVCLALVGSSAGSARAAYPTAAEFADWTAVDGSPAVATGTLNGSPISISGTHVFPPPVSVVDGHWTFFAGPDFTPALGPTDMIQIGESSPAESYTLSFGSPVTDPVIEIGSLGSRLDFPSGTEITKISGQTDFTVSGSSIIGTATNTLGPDGVNDSSGTVQLTGTFTSISFAAFYTISSEDGVLLQVGAAPPPPPPPPPPAPTTTPPPPSPSMAANTASPRIYSDAHTAAGWRYGCTTGTWTGLPANPVFQYSWYRLSTLGTGLRGIFFAPPRRLVATGATYTLPPADAGEKFLCEVTLVTGAGSPLSADSDETVLGGRIGPPSVIGHALYGNFRIRGIDVFRVVQPLPSAQMYGYDPTTGYPNPTLCGGGTPTSYYGVACQSGAPDPQKIDYVGVTLDARKRTAAMVYVDMDEKRATDLKQPLEVTLSGYVAGRQLSGSMTQEITDPYVSETPYVTQDERIQGNTNVQFEIPPAWLAISILAKAPLSLHATVAFGPSPGGLTPLECPLLPPAAGGRDCLSDDSFQLNGIGVSDDFPDLTIKPLVLLSSGQTVSSFPSPQTVLASAMELYPGGERLDVLPYGPSLDIATDATLALSDKACDPVRKDPTDPTKPKLTDAQKLRACRISAINADVLTWLKQDVRNDRNYNMLMGVHDYEASPGVGEPGWTWLDAPLGSGKVPVFLVNDGSLGRPITAAAHEFGHTLGFIHSDTTCGEDKTGVQPGEPWPPGNDGRLQGIGFHWLSGRAGDYEFLPDVVDGNVEYDVMSYCAAGDGNAWMSPRNWNHALSVLTAYNEKNRLIAPAAATDEESGAGFAVGVLGPGGGRIVRIVPGGPDTVAPAPDPSSGVAIRALDAAGRLLGVEGATIQEPLDGDGADTFIAPVPAGTASVELMSGETMLDRRDRSQPPTVRVTAPRGGARVGARGRLIVRWRASDPHGNPLYATVDYAPDGRSWQTLFQGPSTGRATIPAGALTASRSGRIRVIVNDGFAQSDAESAPFRAAGGPPMVHIEVPASGATLQSGRVLLEGAAVDQTGRHLGGRALTWYAGSRRLGTGRALMAALPAGRLAVRLVARDAHGRVSVASVRLAVTPVPLQILSLRAPATASDSRIQVQLATNEPAILRLGGRTYRVGPRPRRLSVSLPKHPRRGVITLSLTLRARAPHQPALHTAFTVYRL